MESKETTWRIAERRRFHSLGRAVSAILCCFALTPHGLAGQDTSSDSKDNVTVRGMVLNEVTKQAIPGALVRTADDHYATLTDDRGRFELRLAVRQPTSEESSQGGSRDLEGNTLRGRQVVELIARKPGYLEHAGTLAVQEGETRILLVPEALITGHVRLQAGEAADRVRVQLFRKQNEEGQQKWQAAGDFSAWSDGEFRFYELEAGTYKLIADQQLERAPALMNAGDQQFGYAPAFYPNARDFESAEVLNITAGTTFDANLSLTRHKFCSVKVAVVNAVAGQKPRIGVYEEGHPGPGYTLTYNPNEQAIQGSLPEGNYHAWVAVEGDGGATGYSNFTVRGAAPEGAEVILQPNTTLNAYVNEEFGDEGNTSQGPPGDEKGAQLPFSQLNLAPAESFGPESTHSSEPSEPTKGRSYVIANVEPGKYRVQVNPWKGYAASVMRDGVNLLQQLLIVGEGESGSPIEVTLRDDGGEVSGLVEGSPERREVLQDHEEGVQSPFAFVDFVPLGDGVGQFRETEVEPDGSFREQQLPPGTYRVLAFDRPHDGWESTAPANRRRYESKGQVLHIGPGAKIALTSSLTVINE